MKNIREYSQTLASSINGKIGKKLYGAQQIAETISYLLEYTDFKEKDLLRSLKNVVEKNDEIYGCSISFEPYAFDKTKYYFDPYFYKPSGIIKYIAPTGGSEYNYFDWEWYTQPKKLNKGVWSEPYFDKGSSDIIMVTYSEPFYKNIQGKRKFCGVIACDVDLNWLSKFVKNIAIFKTGYAFILSSKGLYIEHKNEDHIRLKETIFSVADKWNNSRLKELGEKMVNNQTGFEVYYSHSLGKKCFVNYTPLKETGWSLGIIIPADELFSDLNTVTLKLFMMGIFGYLLTLILIITLANKVTVPLRTLANATHGIGEGDFNAKLPLISSKDEIGVLSRAFQNMQANLVKYIVNLQETTAAKEKIEKELSIARDMQQNLIPHKFPQLKAIDLYAALFPAREIGGDLYDFFLIDEQHLCFAIGDVSGKGIPAALFMAIAKTLLRAKTGITTDPAEIFNAMNEDLCSDNESCMFVTFFIGLLDIKTGILEYCNAGHTFPLIYTTESGVSFLHTNISQPPLGIIANVNYTMHNTKLFPGDMLLLYTDGITEAVNKDNVLFSEEKLLEVFSKNKNQTAPNIVKNVKIAVEQHVLGAQQSDDITMLILKYNGSCPG